uniref:Uncharacterized protein n=1 Tax=Oryzias latipes TaxID=8090 RepID=A0A3P9KC65_ORYLA
WFITSLVGIFFSRVDHKTHQAVCSLKEYKTNRKPRTPFTTMQILYLSFVERTRVKIWPQEAKQDKFQLDAGSRAILYSGFSCIAVPCSASQQGGSAGICRLYRSYKDKHSFPAAHVVMQASPANYEVTHQQIQAGKCHLSHVKSVVKM